MTHPPTDDPLMPIGMFSRASLVSMKALRSYHEMGLLQLGAWVARHAISVDEQFQLLPPAQRRTEISWPIRPGSTT